MLLVMVAMLLLRTIGGLLLSEPLLRTGLVRCPKSTSSVDLDERQFHIVLDNASTGHWGFNY